MTLQIAIELTKRREDRPVPRRPCSICGAPTLGSTSRCVGHQLPPRPRPNPPGRSWRQYGRQWKARARAAIAEQPWCSRCGATEDLTGGHVQPAKHGGTAEQGIVVLCRSCNSSLGATPLG